MSVCIQLFIYLLIIIICSFIFVYTASDGNIVTSAHAVSDFRDRHDEDSAQGQPAHPKGNRPNTKPQRIRSRVRSRSLPSSVPDVGENSQVLASPFRYGETNTVAEDNKTVCIRHFPSSPSPPLSLSLLACMIFPMYLCADYIFTHTHTHRVKEEACLLVFSVPRQPQLQQLQNRPHQVSLSLCVCVCFSFFLFVSTPAWWWWCGSLI